MRSGDVAADRATLARSDSVSVLAEQLSEYLTVRRALGFKLADTERLVRQYLDYLDQAGERRITITTAVA